MLQLLNTDGWLRNIGDRNVHTMEDSIVYIRKLLERENLYYWIARLKENNEPAGILSFLKRDYLDHFDLGFAFLPGYHGKGYAYEAAAALLDFVTGDPVHETVLATTLPQNQSSIRLLDKLGFRFNHEIIEEGERLFVYAITRSG